MNYSGIWYRIAFSEGILFVGGLIISIGSVVSLMRKSSKKGKKVLCIGIFILLVGCFYGISHYREITVLPKQQDIGIFVRSYRDSRVAPPLPLTFGYVFDVGESLKKTYYLDSFSKKKIFSEELIEGGIYRITYSERSRIILNVEMLGKGE